MTGFNAVDVTEFHKAAQSPTAHDPQNSRIGHNYLYVGQLISRKRVESIIHAFSRIASANDELTIVGEGPLRHELSVLAEGVTGRVRLVEHVKNSEMPTVMARNHTLILASQREVWGLVVNEALASGMHVVVAENCGVVPSVRRMAGVFVVEQNLQNLTDKMKESRESWNGRIAEPDILQHTPERFASVFESAFNASHEANIRSKATQ
jgi:glycosyltransferase involved in cell wall biosynthesis